MPRFRDLLTNKNFVFLWLAQVISNFGDRLNQMALVALVYQSNPGSELALAKLISFTIIPVFVIGPIAGAWVDRFDKRNIMIVSDLLRGLLVLSIPLFIISKQILLVYLAIFLIFSISRFFIPSKMALIPELVAKEKLLMANTLQGTTQMIGNVVGLVVAGIIVNIGSIGAIGGFYIDAATFFISAALIAMIVKRRFSERINEDLKLTGEALGESLKRSVFSEIKEGIGYLVTYSNMRFVIASFFLLMAGLGAISCVIIVFIQGAFRTATRDLGFLGLFLVAGLFAGTMAYAKIGNNYNKKKAVLASFVATGIAVMAFTVMAAKLPNLFAVGLMAMLIGGAASPIMVATNTLTHEAIPAEVRGRIFSSLELVIHLAFLLFMFMAAIAAKYVDRSWILVVTGMIFSTCGLWGLLRMEKKA